MLNILSFGQKKIYYGWLIVGVLFLFNALNINKLDHPAATPVSTMLSGLNLIIKKYKRI